MVPGSPIHRPYRHVSRAQRIADFVEERCFGADAGQQHRQAVALPHFDRDPGELRRGPRLELDGHRPGRTRERVAPRFETERANELRGPVETLGAESDRRQPLGQVAAGNRREERALLDRLVIVLDAGDRLRQQWIAPASARSGFRGQALQNPSRKVEANRLGVRKLVQEPFFDVGPIVRGRNEHVGLSLCQSRRRPLQLVERLRVGNTVRVERHVDDAQSGIEEGKDLVVAGAGDHRYRETPVE